MATHAKTVDAQVLDVPAAGPEPRATQPTTKSPRASKTRVDALLVVLFVAAIGLPLGAMLAGYDGADTHAQNREMASFPALERSWASIASFPQGFSDWFADHFGFRSTLVRWYGESRLFGLQVSPASTVVKGRDGWLFYGEDGTLEDYTSEKPLRAEEVAAWHDTLVGTRAWLGARGIAFVFTIVPDKHVIYPEQLPSSIRRLSAMSATDQVIEALRGTGVRVVDARPALVSAKGRERLYDVTDTHWNSRGAMIAYQQIIAGVRAELPSVPPAWPREDFSLTERVKEGQDLAGMIGLKTVMHEIDLGFAPLRPRRARTVEPAGAWSTGGDARIVTEIPGSSLPRALIFRDSFTSRLAPYLSEHFSHAVYLWQNEFDADAVLEERPDVVIQEIVGRHLYTFWPSPELVPHP